MNNRWLIGVQLKSFPTEAETCTDMPLKLISSGYYNALVIIQSRDMRKYGFTHHVVCIKQEKHFIHCVNIIQFRIRGEL